jgi:hypothetical protein
MTTASLPTSADALGPDDLNPLLAAQVPGARLDAFTVVESHVYGSGLASTAGRIVIEPRWTAGSPAELPRRVVVKVARTDDEVRVDGEQTIRGLYANEVAIYTRLDPHRFLEAPRCLGGRYDPRSQTFLLLLEDLRERGATFANVTLETSLARMHCLLDLLATLHARFWDGPRLRDELSWMETHLRGELHDLFNTPGRVPAMIEHLTRTLQFKREMVERLGTTTQRLFEDMQHVQRHQATLPQTVVHGDCHIGNTYILPGDRAGLLDWQLACRGHAVHDVAYVVASGLSVAMRRQHERELLGYYRERLRAHGVADPPSLDALWLEYRRTLVWCVYVGWLTTTVANYGWEICVVNHLRVMTAYEDLETRALVAAMRD